MKVRAIAKGYYNHQIRQPGEVFDLVPYEEPSKEPGGKPRKVSVDEQFASEWMESVDGRTPVAVPKPGANQSADGKEDPNRVLNPNVDDNRKTMTDVVMAHGGEQDPAKVKAAKKGKDVI